MTISDHSGVTKFSKVELTPLDKNSSICNTLDFDGSYLHRLFQCDFACSLTRVHSVLVYVCTRYLSNSITPPRLIHCYAVERCHWVSWPLHNMADWTGKLEVPVSPSTRGCNKYTYYTYWYTSDTSILFYLTRNTCKFLQYFSNFSLVYKIFSQSRDCPVDVYLCLQYITHLSYKHIRQILFHNFGT